MSDFIALFQDAQGFRGNIGNVHPLKLHQWHQGLVGLPDALYMQYGCPLLLEQVQVAVKAVQEVISVLGIANLPVAPQEIARRKIRLFTWHIPSAFDDSGTVPFSLSWDQDASAWQLTCSAAEDTLKTVPDFETGLKKANEWAAELKPQVRENEEEIEE